MVDIVVLGATGYTGKLITRYLAVHRERDSFKFGIAGRSKSKLDRLVSDLNLSGVSTYAVDVTDDASLKALLHDSQAKVLVTTVGPYLKYGMPVARACAQNGVHYIDISGESPFVHDLIVELDYIATKTHTIMIPSSGFDSLPSDALAYLSARTLRSALKSIDERALENVGVAKSHTMLKSKGRASGGTISSILNLVEAKSLKELTQSQSPGAFSLVQPPARDLSKFVWTMPVVRPRRYGRMSILVPHNVAIVQRTRSLFQVNANRFSEDDVTTEDDQPAYAEDYEYSESWEASNAFTALFMSLTIAIGTACLLLSPVRWLVKRLSPAPGEGPSDEDLEKGWLRMDNVSVSTPLPTTGKPIVVESHLRGRGSPGYTLSAVMASEVAIALLAPHEKLTSLARQGGVLTPTTAVGSTLLKRLSATGRFEIESSVLEEGAY